MCSAGDWTWVSTRVASRAGSSRSLPRRHDSAPSYNDGEDHCEGDRDSQRARITRRCSRMDPAELFEIPRGRRCLACRSEHHAGALGLAAYAETRATARVEPVRARVRQPQKVAELVNQHRPEGVALEPLVTPIELDVCLSHGCTPTMLRIHAGHREGMAGIGAGVTTAVVVAERFTAKHHQIHAVHPHSPAPFGGTYDQLDRGALDLGVAPRASSRREGLTEVLLREPVRQAPPRRGQNQSGQPTRDPAARRPLGSGLASRPSPNSRGSASPG